MTRRRKALALAGLWIMATGAAAWTLAPAKVRADVPQQAIAPTPVDLWAKGPVDTGNMVRGVLDYRSEPGQL